MIQYNVVAFKNPQTKELAYRAVPAKQVPVNRRQLLEEMTAESTITPHDVKAVLSGLETHICNSLRNGRSVRLGDLGSFHITFKCKPADSAETFKTANIEGVNIRFTPSATFKYQLSTKHPYVSFSRAAVQFADDKGDVVEP